MDDHTGNTGSRLRGLFLEAAREILREPDASLDLRKVAERAGKSRTAPYLAFGKTEEGGGLAALQLAVAAEGFRALADRMEEAVRSHADPEEGLRRLAAAYLGFARDEPRLFRLMFGPQVGDAAQLPAPPGPGRREQEGLRGARERTEWVIRMAIAREHAGYLRREGSLTQNDLAGAVWAMLHGTAMLTIDEQWETTRLGELDDPEELAGRVLRFLTTASSEVMRGAEEALRSAKAKKGVGLEGESGRNRSASDVEDARETTYWSRFEHRADAAMMDVDADLASGPPHVVREAQGSYFSTPARDAAARSGARRDSSVLRRVRASHHLMESARILWIDDQPIRAMSEAEVFRRLGGEVSWASSTEEAVASLETRRFDLVVSDVARGDDADAGIRGLGSVLRAAPKTPVIFYVANLRPELGVPEGAFGITNDPEELVHLVFDALERRRG